MFPYYFIISGLDCTTHTLQLKDMEFNSADLYGVLNSTNLDIN